MHVSIYVIMQKIIIYTDKDFQGDHYTCTVIILKD